MVVIHPGDFHQGAERPDIETVEEAVPRAGVLLDVSVDPGLLKPRLQLGRRPLQGAVTLAVARHDRAGAAEDLVQILRELSVVDGRDVKPPGGRQQRETAAHAEPDDPGATVTRRLIDEPG